MNRAQPDASEAPTRASDCGAKNSASRAGVTSERTWSRTLTAACPAPAAGDCWLGMVRRLPFSLRPRLTGTAARSGHARLLRQAEHPLADDVALDLARPGEDGPGAAAQEDVLPLGRRVVVALG